MTEKNARFREIDVTSMSESERQALIKRAGDRTSVPQIFVNGERHLGGSDDLRALENKGELDRILQEGDCLLTEAEKKERGGIQ